MRTFINIFILLAMFSVCAIANEINLATQTEINGNKATLTSEGYAKLGLIRIETNKTGSVNLTGNVSVSGTANIVMWAKVEGKYYFSKLPSLQNLKNTENLNFSIPFNSPEKPVTELILDVELPGGGKIEFENLEVKSLK